MIEFGQLDSSSIFDILSMICESEKIEYDKDALRSLSRLSGGDARASVNDLQSLLCGKKELSKEKFEEISGRNKKESIVAAMNKIFKTTDSKIAISAFDNVDEDLSERLLWIDENLPREYTKPKDLALAYEKLSLADAFNGRIRRWQHYRFLVYINALITAGISSSKNERYKDAVQYKQTGRILKLWWAKQKSMKKKAIAEKIAKKTHASKKEVLKSMMPFIPLMFNNKNMRRDISEYLDLDNEEVEWLKGQIR
jgi:replication factor C large subunit